MPRSGGRAGGSTPFIWWPWSGWWLFSDGWPSFRLPEEVAMFSPKVGSVGALISLTGAFLWAAMAAAAGTRRAPLGVIELLLLFATLVTVPLGLELARLVSLPVIGRLGRAARAFQP